MATFLTNGLFEHSQNPHLLIKQLGSLLDDSPLTSEQINQAHSILNQLALFAKQADAKYMANSNVSKIVELFYKTAYPVEPVPYNQWLQHRNGTFWKRYTTQKVFDQPEFVDNLATIIISQTSQTPAPAA